MKRVTIKEVAKRAGVSIATVSRVLNGLGGYGEDTCRLIERTVQELGYQPNTAARTLKTNQSNLLGFVLPVAQTTSLECILYGFEREAEKAGYQVIVCRADNTPEQIQKRISILSRLQLDGIAFCSHQPGEAFDKSVVSSGVPCVLIANPSATGTISSIRADDFAGAYAAAKYMYDKGHRKFALLVGPKEDATAGMSRLNGYRQALIDRGITIDEDLIFCGDFSFEKTLPSARRLISCRDRFTAVLAASDDMAAAVLSAGCASGVHAPDAFSIIGYDDLVTAQMTIPPLTTIAQPFEELGKRALEMLTAEIKTGKKAPACILPTHIVERDTVQIQKNNSA